MPYQYLAAFWIIAVEGAVKQGVFFASFGLLLLAGIGAIAILMLAKKEMAQEKAPRVFVAKNLKWMAILLFCLGFLDIAYSLAIKNTRQIIVSFLVIVAGSAASIVANTLDERERRLAESGGEHNKLTN